MSVIHGKSGAFLEAAIIARGLGLDLAERDILDLDQRLRDGQAKLAEAQSRAANDVAREVAALTTRSRLLASHRRDFVAIRTATVTHACRKMDERAALWRAWGTGVRIPVAWLIIMWLRLRSWAARAGLRGFDRRLGADLRSTETQLHGLRTDPESEMRRRTQREHAFVNAIASLRAKPETAGARGELLLLSALEQLPDDYHILNNVCLRAPSFMTFKGEPLQTAQIDHLVIGPVGVFVIETKNWSVRFLASGNFLSPHDQVGRARHLCNVILKDGGWSTTVRSVIAVAGAAPAPDPDSYARVLRIHEVAGYLRAFPSILARTDVERIASFLWDDQTDHRW